LALLLAVLHQRAAVDLSRHDVYTATVGGARIAESAADLAVCAALASAAFDVPLPEGVVLCGEVGLGGELRAVGRVEHRVAEAIRIGALTVVVPRSTPPIEAESTVGSSLRVQRIGSLPEALNELLAA
jgi:DNA repair protein RadA/Sms